MTDKNPNASVRLEESSIDQLHSAMKAGNLTAQALVQHYTGRITAFDRQGPHISAILTMNEAALTEAARHDAALRSDALLPALHGIPVLVKDNIDTAGLQTSAGARCLEGHVPDQDAFLVRRLKAAGAIVLAKTNLHEFACWGETVSSLGGQTRNPYDLSRTPGGSSGGTGAGIAAGFGAIGIGTDTINSVRSPASACNLVGLRPTLGLVSRAGIVPFGLTQDTAGPITRSVADAARVLDVIAGSDPDDPATANAERNRPESYTAFLDANGLSGARIGILTSLFGVKDMHSDTNAVIALALGVMREQGANLIDLDEPIDTAAVLEETSVHLHELERDLDSYLRRLPAAADVHGLRDVIADGRFHPGIEATIRRAITLSTEGMDYQSRLSRQRALRERLITLMNTHGLDAFAFPHQKRLVAPIGETQVERNGVLAAVTGLPGLVIPAGFSPATATAPLGVPVGIELVGRPFAEATLIRLGYAFEYATHFRHPPVLPPLV